MYLAMDYFQSIIRKSLNNVGIDAETAIDEYYFPFSFEANEENSEFQIVEILGEFEYTYGFEYNAECVVSEWLYRKSLKTNRQTTIFERTTEAAVFGPVVRQECDLYKEQIPAETLVMSFFNKLKLKTDIFRNVYAGIMNISVVPSGFWERQSILERELPEMLFEKKKELLEFLNAIDTGIQNIICEENGQNMEFITEHKGRDGKNYTLNLLSESEGTIKSIVLFIVARKAILNNKSMFVDELNIKLHPLLLKFVIDLFYNQNSAAQLIYTTHDTTLMDKKFFRRDQIWFVQKDEYGYSTLSALSDYKIRADASFEKDYLAGVYGGIPFLKEFEMKTGESHGLG